MKSIATLIRLSKNPAYKMNEKELEALQKFQNSQLKGHSKQVSPVRHSTDVKKHDYNIPQEEDTKKGN